jgi:uncharacterized SAM-binding protein YcdF (DUF218 family)
MFFILSKLVAFLLKPAGIILVFMSYLIFDKNHTKTKKVKFLTVSLTYLLFCPAFSNYLISKWEPIPDTNIPNAKIGIVLTGGIIREEFSTKNQIFLGDHADRIYQALRLYRAHKISKIIISGGDAEFQIDEHKLLENDGARDFLIENGVNPEDIYQEKKSRNTRENALYTAELIKKEHLVGDWALITSAFHMRRATACFNKVNLKTTPVCAAFLGRKSKTGILDFIPSTFALRNLDYIINEWIGLASYKLMGYI